MFQSESTINCARCFMVCSWYRCTAIHKKHVQEFVKRMTIHCSYLRVFNRAHCCRRTLAFHSKHFSPSTSVSPANLHCTNCSTITLIYHLGLYNRPEVAAVPGDVSSTPLKKKHCLYFVCVQLTLHSQPCRLSGCTTPDRQYMRPATSYGGTGF
jgi:hypothetical protein